ncbi:MAG: DinB family protein [Acidobacteria bacterium]|nr:DinB family protein [Acidobacteriota bacterium]
MMEALRKRLVELLDGGWAHVTFDAAVADWPQELQGRKPKGASHTPWEVLEHLRLAQWDILEFSRDPHHKSPAFPEGYWPETSEPPLPDSWGRSVAQFKLDLDALKALVESPEMDLFAPFPWGDGQDLAREAMVAADHNAYHLGELMTLRRMLGI